MKDNLIYVEHVLECIARHPGAIEWARRQALAVDRVVPHFTAEEIAPGDVVISTLPVNLAGEACARGATYPISAWIRRRYSRLYR